jgi:hypothetical protein
MKIVDIGKKTSRVFILTNPSFTGIIQNSPIENMCIGYYENGLRHRKDGPAYYQSDGFKTWYKNGLKHREDGPAVIIKNHSSLWYLNGILYATKAQYDHELINYRMRRIIDK